MIRTKVTRTSALAGFAPAGKPGYATRRERLLPFSPEPAGMPEPLQAFSTTFPPAMARVRIGRHGDGTGACADTSEGWVPLLGSDPRRGGQPLRDHFTTAARGPVLRTVIAVA